MPISRRLSSTTGGQGVMRVAIPLYWITISILGPSSLSLGLILSKSLDANLWTVQGVMGVRVAILCSHAVYRTVLLMRVAILPDFWSSLDNFEQTSLGILSGFPVSGQF